MKKILLTIFIIVLCTAAFADSMFTYQYNFKEATDTSQNFSMIFGQITDMPLDENFDWYYLTDFGLNGFDWEKFGAYVGLKYTGSTCLCTDFAMSVDVGPVFYAKQFGFAINPGIEFRLPFMNVGYIFVSGVYKMEFVYQDGSNERYFYPVLRTGVQVKY